MKGRKEGKGRKRKERKSHLCKDRIEHLRGYCSRQWRTLSLLTYISLSKQLSAWSGSLYQKSTNTNRTRVLGAPAPARVLFLNCQQVNLGEWHTMEIHPYFYIEPGGPVGSYKWIHTDLTRSNWTSDGSSPSLPVNSYPNIENPGSYHPPPFTQLFNSRMQMMQLENF